jgi:predicted porin
MFKKTLIAAAVATVASTAAMADVTIGGKVEQNFTWTCILITHHGEIDPL